MSWNWHDLKGMEINERKWIAWYCALALAILLGTIIWALAG